MITAVPVLRERQHAAVITLALSLAEQLDQAGPAASARATQAYLSVLKDLQRIAATAKPTPGEGSGKRALLQRMRADTAARTASVTHSPAVTAPVSNAGESDAELLARLDPPPSSVADVRERMRWGTKRASAALRSYRGRDTT